MTTASTSTSKSSGFISRENRFCTSTTCGYLETKATVNSAEVHCCAKCGEPTEFRRLNKLSLAEVYSDSTDGSESGTSADGFGAPQVFGMCDVEIAPGKWVSRSEWNRKVAETEAANPGKTLIRVDDNLRKLQYESRKHDIITRRRELHGHTEAEVEARDRRARANQRERQANGTLNSRGSRRD